MVIFVPPLNSNSLNVTGNRDVSCHHPDLTLVGVYV